MSIFLYFFSLIENLPSDRAFHVSSEFDLSVRSREKEISAELSLGVLSSGRGSGSRWCCARSSAGRLPSNQTEMWHRGRADGEDEQKCGQRIQQDGSRHRGLISSLFLILSRNGACKYGLWKASQFIYGDAWRPQRWGKPGEWSCHQRIVLSRVHCVSKRGQIVHVNTRSACLSLRERESSHKHPVVLYID